MVMDDSFEDEILLLILSRRRRKRLHGKFNRAPLRFLVRSIFTKCEQLGEYHRIIQELKNDERERFNLLVCLFVSFFQQFIL